ncbi:type VI secretion system protein TssL, long form [Paraburkholderia phymatum]|uniref:Type IV / VI secretion system protein, DotU family n=1 Tax=Paraburkholderia phymatum (strain DSM 17167 / CIP 108236 / LMG 21445 / STM815) TaxID=391038 RepID=B2JTX0_PARP8|nr:type VI secretion system protein TssL, long form [Paraburkholderia phymatum]ACC76023.1 type IV / VI secretion system protein, DotU family [Paraburkholderia phymatum STM815]
MSDKAALLRGTARDTEAQSYADAAVSGQEGLPYEVPLGEPALERLTKVRSAANPLLEAARVLLRSQADIPEMDLGAKGVIPTLRQLLLDEMKTFQKLCEQTSIRRDHMIGARYCLCTALDEAVMETPWGRTGDNGVSWGTVGLATNFHEDRDGGTKIYLLVARLMQDPDQHDDLLEVIYHILSFGFEGRYRSERDGHRKHEAVRQRIYNEIMARRPPVPVELSPHARSDVPPRRQSFYDFPVWITVTVLSLILLGMWGYFKYQLVTRADDIQKQIGDIARMTPPPAPPVLHLKTLLKDEIAAGTVSVDEDAKHSAVTFRGDSMFPPGGVAVNTSMGPLIAKIAAEIVKVPGKVTVLGYTDNLPIHSHAFASNDALSAERATQVLQMLQADGVPASRLEAMGKGEADPVADNSTPQGRAQNRRVEIHVAE